jgi:hypothetical protein
MYFQRNTVGQRQRVGRCSTLRNSCYTEQRRLQGGAAALIDRQLMPAMTGQRVCHTRHTPTNAVAGE